MQKKQKKSVISKRKMTVVFAAAAVCITAAVFTAASKQSVPAEKIAAYVDEEPVYYEELKYFINRNKLIVREALISQSGKESSDFQWGDEIEGETGYERLVSESLKKAVPVKLVLRESKKLGLAGAEDYPELMKSWKDENAGRKEKKQNDQVLYGVIQYSKEEYYDYVNSNLELRYKEKLISGGTVNVSDEEIRAAYDKDSGYFNNESFETVRDSAKLLALERKYEEYLSALEEKADINITDKDAVTEAVKEVLGETS